MMADQWGRPGEHWHTIQVHDCLHRSRNHANWTAFIDLDERLFANETTESVGNYLRFLINFRIKFYGF